MALVMRFDFPWAFLILAVLPLVFLSPGRRGAAAAILFPFVGVAARCSGTMRTRLAWLPGALRLAAVILLIFALARPQSGRETIPDVGEGIAIEMVVDRSGSMGSDFSSDGSQINRIDAVKAILKEFAFGNGKDLKGRTSDLIGTVVFARDAQTLCPLTLNHEVLHYFIDDLRVVGRKEEDGTAIGDALALAAARLRLAERLPAGEGGGKGSYDSGPKRSDPGDGYEIKNKVIILLTDGQQNAGRRSPAEAVRLVRDWGIRVYAVGIGGRESTTVVPTPFGEYRATTGPGVNEETLKAVTRETGGTYWMAESTEALRDVCREIDGLEKTRIREPRFTVHAEKFAAFVFAALGMLLLEVVLRCTLFRRVP